MEEIYITEIWKPVWGYENYYEVSNTGIVRSLDRVIKLKRKGTRKFPSKIIKTRVNNCGYLEVRLSKCNIHLTTFIHVLMAQAFIPNPERKKEVNHINGIKTDNRLCNLEWCTHAENIKHAYDTGLLVKMSKSVIDNCTGEIYLSIKEAAKAININYGTCRNYLNGNIKNNKTCLSLAS